MHDYKLITVLCRRFDYSGAHNVTKALGLHETPLGSLLRLCMSSVNFDFTAAREQLPSIRELFDKQQRRMLESNLEDLIQGKPDAMFSEHIWSMRFQLEQEEFLDFLGRLYRFNEAFLKYLFVLKHVGKKTVFDDIYKEGRILRILRNKYDIKNRNIIFAIQSFLQQLDPPMPGVRAVLDFFTGKEMKALVELRNDSIVGHGYRGVSRELITEQFAPPDVLLDYLVLMMEKNGLSIDTEKYYMINDTIKQTLKRGIDDACSIRIEK